MNEYAWLQLMKTNNIPIEDVISYMNHLAKDHIHSLFGYEKSAQRPPC